MREVIQIIEACIPIIGCLGVFGIPLAFFYFKHQVNMRNLDLQAMTNRPQANSAEIEALRQDLRSLRETAMQYDIAFDTALQNMDKRVGQLEIERRSNATEQYAHQQNGR